MPGAQKHLTSTQIIFNHTDTVSNKVNYFLWLFHMFTRIQATQINCFASSKLNKQRPPTITMNPTAITKKSSQQHIYNNKLDRGREHTLQPHDRRSEGTRESAPKTGKPPTRRRKSTASIDASYLVTELREVMGE